MIILHCSVIENELLLWAERQFVASEIVRNRDAALKFAARQEEPSIDIHPFTVDGKTLYRTISDATEFRRTQKAIVASSAIWLPTVGGMPLPSSHILYSQTSESDSPEASTLRPWIVEAIRLFPAELIEIVLRYKHGHIIAPGILLGAEFDFLHALIRFAAVLTVKQQYLPTVLRTATGYRAIWQPVLIDADHAQLTRLTASMPHVVRSISMNDAQNAQPSTSSAAVAKELLAMFIDSMVRGQSANPASSADQMKKDGFDSIHHCWLHALSSADGTMIYDQEKIAHFAHQVTEWQSPVISGNAAPFRLCFRLDEPRTRKMENDPLGLERLEEMGMEVSEQWKVTYLLQSLSDKSLMIPADEAWRDAVEVKGTFAAHQFNPRRFLLQSLGEASHLCNEINMGLINNDLTGYELDDMGAFEFMTEKAQSLQEANFGVMVPSWWNKARRKVRVKAVVKTTPKIKGDFTLDRIVEFEWKVAVGGVELTFKELTALAKLKIPLVKIRGEWIHLDPADIKTAIELLKQKAQSSATVSDLIRFSLGAQAPKGFSGKVEVEASGWIKDFLSQLEESSKLEELPAPPGFKGELRPYQKRGYSWLSFLSKSGLGACLADDMGLGKTIQTLALLQDSRTKGSTRPTLLICPTSVINNWKKEAAKFAPDLSVLIHHGPKRMKGEKFVAATQANALVVSSYNLVQRDLDDLRRVRWEGVILDEAQNVKNAFAKTSVAVRELSTDFRIALTGTPVENNVADLWSIMEFLNPGMLGEIASFRRAYFYPIQAMNDPEATAKLQRITQPFILRRLKTDKSIIADLPEKQEMKVFCSLTKEQVTLYSAVLKDFEEQLKTIDDERKGGLVLSTLHRLKQVCNHPAHFLADKSSLLDRSGKLRRVVEIIEEVSVMHDKVLIFSQYKEMGELIKSHLEERFGEEVLFLHGGVSRQNRDEMVERFQSESGPSVFMLSLKAGGTGLNLTAANQVIHYDRWWNPAVENQASDRAYRIGQKKMVQVRKFICAGTLEEKIDKLIDSKMAIAEKVVSTGEAWLSKMSNDELRQVFALNKEELIEDGS